MLILLCARRSGIEFLRPFGPAEMRRVYRFTRLTFVLAGLFLDTYGAWFFVTMFLSQRNEESYWLGLLPIYIGAMMILVSLAMKEDWFTNARKYW